MLYLLDTNAVSDLMAEDRTIVSRSAAHRPTDSVAICTIVRGEILFGVERLPSGKRRADLLAKATRVLSDLHCHTIPEAVADTYARLKQICRSAGLSLDENDLWIASTAISLNATLDTRDNDFVHVPGLKIEDWTK